MRAWTTARATPSTALDNRPAPVIGRSGHNPPTQGTYGKATSPHDRIHARTQARTAHLSCATTTAALVAPLRRTRAAPVFRLRRRSARPTTAPSPTRPSRGSTRVTHAHDDRTPTARQRDRRRGPSRRRPPCTVRTATTSTTLTPLSTATPIQQRVRVPRTRRPCWIDAAARAHTCVADRRDYPSRTTAAPQHPDKRSPRPRFLLAIPATSEDGTCQRSPCRTPIR